MSASALLFVIFIDKFNISGIELIILDRLIARKDLVRLSAGQAQVVEEHLDIHRRGLATT
jgi:hypothetical protein